MLVTFSPKEYDKGTIIKIEVAGHQTYFLFHNSTGEDLVAMIHYKEDNSFPKRLIKKDTSDSAIRHRENHRRTRQCTAMGMAWADI